MEEPGAHSSAAPQKPKKSYISKNIRLLATLAILLLAAASYGIFNYESKNSAPPFPIGTASGQVGFPIYYTVTAVSGYSYQVGSEKVSKAGILFYSLENGKKKIFVTEQAIPAGAINFNSLPKHNTINLPIGRGFIGTGLGNPSIVVLTNSTLISISSSKGVTATDVK